MNLRQPYEQLIADKLRHLPAPDANNSWQQMKRLLDDDEDTRGGGRKRPPGNSGWWRVGMLAIVLIAGFWIYEKTATPDTRLSTTTTNATAPAAANNNTPAATDKSNNHQTPAIDNTTTLKTAADNSSANEKTATATGAETVKEKITPNNPALEPASAPGNTVAVALHENAHKKNNYSATGAAGNTTLPRQQRANTNQLVDAGDIATKNKPGTRVAAGNEDPTIVPANHSSQQLDKPTFRSSVTGHYTSKTPVTSDADTKAAAAEKDTFSPTNDRAIAVGNHQSFNPTAVAGNQTTWLERITGLKISTAAPSYNTSLAAGDSLANNRDVSNLLNNETKKSVAKALRDKEIAMLDKKDKKFRLSFNNVFKPFSMRPATEPWWAAGIAVNGGVTVGAQNRFNYNLNGKSGSLSDYIPSPYLQYHLNDYVYFQTELNFVSPQYTPQLLLFRNTNDAFVLGGSPALSLQKSIYVQKMYYFNWPVSLHYSPVKNLFFSGGIQFSSFQSGLAVVEEKKYETALGPDHSTSLNSRVLKFKDDSIAAKIAPNEWRWQVGAEYYINRFSVGLRYNQSFKKSINTIAAPGMSPTINRNESLLFFIRYNLFESRNKRSEGDK